MFVAASKYFVLSKLWSYQFFLCNFIHYTTSALTSSFKVKYTNNVAFCKVLASFNQNFRSYVQNVVPKILIRKRKMFISPQKKLTK